MTLWSPPEQKKTCSLPSTLRIHYKSLPVSSLVLSTLLFMFLTSAKFEIKNICVIFVWCFEILFPWFFFLVLFRQVFRNAFFVFLSAIYFFSYTTSLPSANKTVDSSSFSMFSYLFCYNFFFHSLSMVAPSWNVFGIWISDATVPRLFFSFHKLITNIVFFTSLFFFYIIVAALRKVYIDYLDVVLHEYLSVLGVCFPYTPLATVLFTLFALLFFIDLVLLSVLVKLKLPRFHQFPLSAAFFFFTDFFPVLITLFFIFAVLRFRLCNEPCFIATLSSTVFILALFLLTFLTTKLLPIFFFGTTYVCISWLTNIIITLCKIDVPSTIFVWWVVIFFFRCFSPPHAYYHYLLHPSTCIYIFLCVVLLN